MSGRTVAHSGIVCSHPARSIAEAYQGITDAAISNGFHAVVGVRFIGNKYAFNSPLSADHFIQAYGTGIAWH
ncbi:hypothetical protein [Micromonospora sonneratiae]|uniref:Uncharacterized protein n=1 Tax=Micromonospora sonneratiae TaxID=1184706 RepID=A0ABW3Y9Y7_9ACTN